MEGELLMKKSHSFKCLLFVFFVFIFLLGGVVSDGFAKPDLTFKKHRLTADFEGALHGYAVDLDLDEDVDFITSASQIDTISWWENTDNKFSEHVIDNSFDGVLHIHAVDLDLDGDIDISGGAQIGNELAWWENDGEMVFTKHIVDNIVAARSLYSGDIDQDGDLDLYSTSDNDISWWENDGLQNFTKHTLISRATPTSRGFIRHIFAVDLDKDTDIDFISGDNVWRSVPTDNTIYYWLNDGNQNFTQFTIPEKSYSEFHGFDVIDLDQDGDFDLCATSPNHDQIDWFENDGQLNFSQHTVVNTFDGANDVHAGDIDDDGDFDLIAAAYFDDEISWFENDGNQHFTEHVIGSNFDGAQTCWLSDINGDNLTDVLGLAWESGEVSWWEQTTGSSSSTPSFCIDIVLAVCCAFVLIRRKRNS